VTLFGNRIFAVKDLGLALNTVSGVLVKGKRGDWKQKRLTHTTGHGGAHL
jgi:hypothetical protein